MQIINGLKKSKKLCVDENCQDRNKSQGTKHAIRWAKVYILHTLPSYVLHNSQMYSILVGLCFETLGTNLRLTTLPVPRDHGSQNSCGTRNWKAPVSGQYWFQLIPSIRINPHLWKVDSYVSLMLNKYVVVQCSCL